MKYIDIKTVGPDAYQVWAMWNGAGTSVTRDGGKLDLNRRAVGLRVRKGYKPPEGPPGTFTKHEAIHVAHQVGRYMFNLGDMVFAYTTVDGWRNEKFFEE
jgi:hypothetical protein